MGDIDRHHLVRTWLATLPSTDQNNTPPHASPPSEEGSLLGPPPAGDTRSPVLPASGSSLEQRGGDGGDHGISYQQPTSATLTSHTPHLLGDNPVHAPNQPCTPPAVPGKRKRPSHSKSSKSLSTTCTPSPTPSEVLAKRRALQPLTASSVAPPPSFQPPVASVPHLPSHVLTVLRLLAPAQFELHCLPFTPHIGSLLDTFFPTEFFPPHTRLDVLAPDDPSRALAFLDLITRAHATCVHNFSNGLDETAWYPCIRTLLSIDPPPPLSRIPTLPPLDPHIPTPDELFLTLNATTKPTRRNLPPDHPGVKLDYLLAFNPKHADCQPTTATIQKHNLTVNAFNDTTIEEVIVLLGVKVKTPSRPLLGAEFQVGVWAAKTLALTRSMTRPDPPPAETCDLAVSLTVYGHVWSMHVTYWNSENSLVTQGPVLIGSTDTLYGTLKIVKFVVVLKEWARSKVLEDWRRRVQVAVR